MKLRRSLLRSLGMGRGGGGGGGWGRPPTSSRRCIALWARSNDRSPKDGPKAVVGAQKLNSSDRSEIMLRASVDCHRVGVDITRLPK